MTDAPFDEDRLDELLSEIGAEDLGAVLDLFLAEACEAASGLHDALTADEYAKAMHFLRSGAVNLGLLGLAAEARRLARLPDPERRAETAAPALVRTIDACRAALAGRLTA